MIGANIQQPATSGGSVTPGTVDNAIVRANGTGNNAIQGSDINIDDATTSTQNNVALVNQHSGQTNSALVLTPKGTGAFVLGPKPDGTTTGGNARGVNAVDLQLTRTASGEIASGEGAFTAGRGNTASNIRAVALGNGNTASGNSSVAIGRLNVASNTFAAAIGGSQNTSSGEQSFSCGLQNTASGNNSGAFGASANANRLGMQAHASGLFASVGDAQRVRFVLRCKTTTNTAVQMALDGATTYLSIPSGKIISCTINITGAKSDGTAVAHYLRQYCVKNVAGTSSQVYAPVTIGSDNAAGTSIALSANDTNDTLRIDVTGVASETWRWVATVDAVEFTYGT